MTIFRCSILFVIILLAACSQKTGDEDLICQQTPGFIVSAATSSVEQLETTEMCIHKWAYRLGRGAGSNTEIARATVGACREALDYYLKFKVEEANATDEPFSDEQWQESAKRFEELALFRVVQGRAGQCTIRGVDQK